MYPNLFACIVFVNNDLFVAFDSVKKYKEEMFDIITTIDMI